MRGVRTRYRTEGERAYLAIKATILSGKVKPGDMLTESVLAEQLNMSRTPIREGLRRLQQEGLVKPVPFVGMQVRQLSPRDLVEIYELRACFETFAVQNRLVKGPIDISQYEKIVDAQESALASSRVNKAVELGWEFHSMIVSLSENSHMMRITENLSDQLKVYALPMLKQESNWRLVIGEHREIVAALGSGDVDRCVDVVRVHLSNALVRILSTSHGLLTSRGDWEGVR